MKDNVDVDIIIPIYNVSKYLKKCLDSIIQQSFSNYNVLLIDDGSTDDSKVICKEFSKKIRDSSIFLRIMVDYLMQGIMVYPMLLVSMLSLSMETILLIKII